MSAIIKSKMFTVILTSISFLIVFIPNFIEIPIVDSFSNDLIGWTLIATYFLSIITIYTSTRRNIIKVQEKKHGWIYGLIFLISLYYMLAVGFIFGETHISFTFFYDAILIPVGAMLTGVLLFTVASASAKSFRIRDFKSFLLLTAAFIIYLKNAPIGGVIWSGFGPLGEYVMDIVSASANRAFKIGTAAAGIALTMRVLLGRETSSTIQAEE